MTTQTLKDKLIALNPGPNSVYVRRLGQVLPEIEAALSKGVSREAIIKTLREDGIDVTLNGFAKALYRLRKRAKEQATESASMKGSAVAETPSSIEAVARTEKRPFEPNDIRAIARNRPDLTELARLGREASKAKDKAGKP